MNKIIGNPEYFHFELVEWTNRENLSFDLIYRTEAKVLIKFGEIVLSAWDTKLEVGYSNDHNGELTLILEDVMDWMDKFANMSSWEDRKNYPGWIKKSLKGWFRYGTVPKIFSCVSPEIENLELEIEFDNWARDHWFISNMSGFPKPEIWMIRDGDNLVLSQTPTESFPVSFEKKVMPLQKFYTLQTDLDRIIRHRLEELEPKILCSPCVG